VSLKQSPAGGTVWHREIVIHTRLIFSRRRNCKDERRWIPAFAGMTSLVQDVARRSANRWRSSQRRLRVTFYRCKMRR